MTTGHAQPAASSRTKRVVGTVVIVAIAILGYGWFSLSQGWVWPVPSITPGHIARFNNQFDRESGVCHPLSYWTQGRHKIAGLRQIGTIPSALVFGAAPAYSSPSGNKQFTYYTFMLVKNGGCYQYYTAQQTG